MSIADTETDLFGVPVAPLKPRETPRPVVNDMDLIERVLRMASEEGFMLVGVREDVYRKIAKDRVERVPRDVDATVHQLIDAKWLDVGGSNQVRYDRYMGPARSVLVPRKARQTAARWRSMSRPRSWDEKTTGKG